jgi:hypothetical protein
MFEYESKKCEQWARDLKHEYHTAVVPMWLPIHIGAKLVSLLPSGAILHVGIGLRSSRIPRK